MGSFRDPFANNPNVPRPAPVVDPDDEWRTRMLAALDQLAAAVADRPEIPPPVLEVPPPDLSELVTAVTQLKGPATAEEIAEALAAVLRRDPNPPADTADVMAEMVAALKKMDFRLKGGGGNMIGTGGGSVEFSPKGLTQLSGALTATTTVTPVVATVTASGDTTLHTPTAGKAVRLHWVSAINDPDEASSPLIKVSLGTTELYRAYAVAHRQTFTGAANDALIVNLSDAASVAVTAHIEEV